MHTPHADPACVRTRAVLHTCAPTYVNRAQDKQTRYTVHTLHANTLLGTQRRTMVLDTRKEALKE
jgi:hypothetical protein